MVEERSRCTLGSEGEEKWQKSNTLPFRGGAWPPREEVLSASPWWPCASMGIKGGREVRLTKQGSLGKECEALGKFKQGNLSRDLRIVSVREWLSRGKRFVSVRKLMAMCFH
ncbi:hypothetical protein QYF36_010753 [Acer negundo]|nr:hypothetical protein QYF36_010753 [Acer negundo]